MTNDDDDHEATLAVLAVLETAWRPHRPTEQADAAALLAPYAHNGRPLLTAALQLLTAVLPVAFDNPIDYLTLVRAEILDELATRR